MAGFSQRKGLRGVETQSSLMNKSDTHFCGSHINMESQLNTCKHYSYFYLVYQSTWNVANIQKSSTPSVFSEIDSSLVLLHLWLLCYFLSEWLLCKRSAECKSHIMTQFTEQDTITLIMHIKWKIIGLKCKNVLQAMVNYILHNEFGAVK